MSKPENVSKENDPGATPGLSGSPASVPESSSVAESNAILSVLTDNLSLDAAPPVVLNKDGTIKKKPGRKPGQRNGETVAITGGTSPPKAPRTQHEKKAMAASAEAIGTALINAAVGAMVATVGDEWNFQSVEEAQGIKSAVVAYIDMKGDDFFTPEMMLGLVLTGYASPRVAHENTRTKFAKFFGGIWRFFRRK